jgi:tRNA (guanine26-N2/guanine27-N2)-dimethyltransferase
LRYAQEIPLNTSIVANDMNPNAIKSMKLNVEHNGLSSSITPNLGDAIGHMYQVAYPPINSHGPQHVSKKYDVIDLDPYGSAAPFIDAALQAINDGGLLCVTCTDAGVWASTGYCEKTYALYGGMPIKGSHMHEGGLRLIISSIASAAAKYGLAIEPLLSLNIDFYARVFIRVQKSAADVKFLAGKTMLVYGCDHGCGAWTTNMIGRNTKQTSKNSAFHYKHTIAQAPGADRLCDHCKSKMHIAGPMWGGPIHNAAFIEKILSDLPNVDQDVYRTTVRIEGMLATALDELSVNEDPIPDRASSNEIIPKIPAETTDSFPFFFNVSTLSKVLHCVAPGDAPIKGALRHAGYHVTRSHCQPGSIKTNASWAVIWEIMREWVRQRSPIKEGKLREGSSGWEIMKKAREDVDESSENAKAVESEADGQAKAVDTPEIITDLEPRKKIPGEVGRNFKVVFDEALGRDKERDSRLKNGRKVVRYQMNPRENWGPMTKAKGSG